MDWIKMRTDLYRDPKVCVMAEILFDPDSELSRYINQMTQRDSNVTRNVARNVVIGGLLSIWGVMRQRGKQNDLDLVCHGVTVSVLDDVADLPGFGPALEYVGWVEQTDDGIVFKRFFEDYNTDPQKAKAAERQRRYRDRQKEKQQASQSVTRDVTVSHREEKRRDITPIVPFSDFWEHYPKKVSKGQAEKTWKKLSPSPDLFTEILKGLEASKKCDQWTRDKGKFIPNPSTWLNAKGWEDEHSANNGGTDWEALGFNKGARL